MNIVIVGGGNAAVNIIKHFQIFKQHKIIGIADIKSDAPGILKAQEMKIPTSDNMEDFVKQKDAELIIELTGSPKVQDILTKMARPDQQIVTAKGAKLMSDLIETQNECNGTIAEEISKKFKELTNGLEKTLAKIDTSFNAIETLLREGNIISINASIEAARAGEAGRPFEIVVTRISHMVKQIKDASVNIGQASKETSDTIKDIINTAKKLDETFAKNV